MARTIKPMVRSGQKARIAFPGPAKAGKTWTSLEWAVALEKIEVAAGNRGGILGIDTERGEMGLYADKFVQGDGQPISHMVWDPPFDPVELGQQIREVSKDYAVIVIDSGSHFWEGEGGVFDIVDDAQASSNNRNKFAGWKEGTPAHMEMINAITRADCHVIFTMRSKMKYVMEENDRGKQTPKRVGLAPVQRDDMEYEFTVIATVDMAHEITVLGSRCDLLEGRRFKKGKTVELAEILGEWLLTAEPLASAEQVAEITKAVKALEPSWYHACRADFRDQFGPSDRLTAAEVPKALEYIKAWRPVGELEGTPDDIAAEAVAKATPAKKATKKPATREAAAKKGAAIRKAAAKKATKRAASKASKAPETPDGEPWGDGAETGPEGSEGLTEAQSQRAELDALMMGAAGKAADVVAEALGEYGLWPISKAPDDQLGLALEIANDTLATTNEEPTT